LSHNRFNTLRKFTLAFGKTSLVGELKTGTIGAELAEMESP